MSPTLEFVEGHLQEAALVFMAIVYTKRILWLLKFKPGKDRQARTGLPGITTNQGIIYSLANIAMPWAMESTRKKFILYVQFVIFHLGVVCAITMSFVIPYAPSLMNGFVTAVFRLFIGGAFLVGCYRIFRRVTVPVMKAISTPDDYFSLILLTVWFLFAFLAAPNTPEKGEASLMIYFIMTAFFLVYVPFSKISHYLYYPFTRFYFGRTMGHRGVYPLKPSQKPDYIRQ